VRRYTLNAQIARLARVLIWLVFKAKSNLAEDRAGRIKQQALGALKAKDGCSKPSRGQATLKL
jgi:hypothetical protein